LTGSVGPSTLVELIATDPAPAAPGPPSRVVFMTRTARHALVASLIVLHAAVVVCGAGLHALPGWGHESGLHSRARNDHSHGPGKSSHEAADDCAVCQFLAQGQISCETPPAVAVRITSVVARPAAPVADIAPPRSPSSPRGPPPTRRPV